jgi:hypothetical protein
VLTGSGTEPWAPALVVLGLGLVAGSGFLGGGLGEPSVLAGVGLFFATVALAAVERYNLAAATGTAGLVLVALGVALTLGTVHSSPAAIGSLAAVGVALAAVGGAFARRASPSAG